MPVEVAEAEGSLSPPLRQPTLSPERDTRKDEPGPSKRYKNNVVDQQRRQVEKLLSNPDRQLNITVGTKEKTLRAPREMMKNVQGSSAGAGSGEFHVYKQSRRREYERLKIMNDKARAEEEQAAFVSRQAERDALADAKTAKNRAKRQKRKQGRKGGGAADGSGSATPDFADVIGVGQKRKLAGGNASTVKFKRPGEESDTDDDEEEEEVGPKITVPIPSIPEQDVPRVVEEKRITIVDED